MSLINIERNGNLMSSVVFKEVPIEEIYPLRHQVLRKGQPIDTCYYPEDSRQGVFHVAALEDDNIIGIASFYPEVHVAFDSKSSWRLRGMATSESVRGLGIGRKLLEQGINECRKKGGDLLWCNARTSAAGFYRKLNFAIQGEVFNIENIGPHYVMYKKL